MQEYSSKKSLIMIGVTYGINGLEEGLPVIKDDDYTFVRIGESEDSPKLYLHKRKPPIENGRIKEFYADTVYDDDLDAWVLKALKEFVPAQYPPFILLVKGELVKTQATFLIRNEDEGYYLFEMNRNTYIQIENRGSLVSIFNRDGKLSVENNGKRRK